MQFNFKEDKIFIFSLVFILCAASILRFYNLNFDDLWADEIFSFWIADPNISLTETLHRAFSSSLNFFYDVGLKYFHMIFDYDVYVSRYFSLLLSILSLILFAFLLLKITSKESVIFGSELKVIKSSKTENLKISKNASYYYSMLGYVPAPLSIYENVFKVMPSEIVEITKSNKIIKKNIKVSNFRMKFK